MGILSMYAGLSEPKTQSQKEINMKKMTILLTVALALLVAGCNTARGFGQDLQKVGEKIEDKTKPKP